jgi:protein-ribulosamine 3-kinase
MAILKEQLKIILCDVLDEKEILLQEQGGGCINQCFQLKTGDYKYFCKVNSVSKLPRLFEAEAKGLDLIKNSNTFNTPEVINIFYKGDYQILILEWIEEGEKTLDFWKKFGSSLSSLHNITSNQFGLNIENFMGSVPQSNKKNINWTSFFLEQRLQPLVKRCRENNLLSSAHENIFQKLFQKLPEYFENVKPALVHGDLWSGNFMCNTKGEPVLVDPAVYYGIPSVDIGMTQLFGGFHNIFYKAYHDHSGYSPGEEQNKICNLYPLLIHLFLFGKSYLPQIEETIKEFK